MRSALAPRVLGGLTGAYGAYTLMRPQSLVRATGLQPADQPESAFLGNVIGFGLAVPARSKLKVVAIAIGWGVLCASTLPTARRTK